MAKYVHYHCSACGGVFKHLHVLSDEPPPDTCGLCHAPTEPQPTFVPQAPGIKKSLFTKSMDQTYRAMEDASISRAAEAAEMAGVPVADMSHIKITDMKDPSNMRPGDISAVLPPTPPNNIAQLMRNNPGLGGGFNPLTVGGAAVPGQMLAAQAHTGDAPHAGENVRSNVVASHRDRAWAMQRAGQMGSYNGRG